LHAKSAPWYHVVVALLCGCAIQVSVGIIASDMTSSNKPIEVCHCEERAQALMAEL